MMKSRRKKLEAYGVIAASQLGDDAVRTSRPSPVKQEEKPSRAGSRAAKDEVIPSDKLRSERKEEV